MSILYFQSVKEAERALSQVRHGSQLKAIQGKVLFIPPSERWLLSQLGFSFEELARETLEERLDEGSYKTFVEWQLYEAHKLYEDEASIPPWPLREAYFDMEADDAASAHEVFKNFTIENLSITHHADALTDTVRVRFYINRNQLSRLESALKAAQLCGHCKENELYKCKDPDSLS